MSTSAPHWLLYGANGYTAKLIAQRAIAAGQRPILAGRDERSIRQLGQELDCPTRVFSLAQPDVVAQQLADVKLVLNCAGPFIKTAGPMIEACLQAGVHYLDITGEWKVLQLAAQQNERAKQAGVVLMPAAGFDVVPSDCLAMQLSQACPGADRLELAFRVTMADSSISPGTATTVFSQLGQGTYARIDGQLKQLPQAWQSIRVPFSSGERVAVAISWGDIVSAFHSTGIPNIRVYQAMSQRQLALLRRWNWLLPLVRLSPVQWFGRRWIKRNIPGPTATQREAGHAEFWGRATDKAGHTAEATLITPEGYTLTSHTTLEIVQRVLSGEVSPGFSTPAQGLGGTFIEQFAGVQLNWISRTA